MATTNLFSSEDLRNLEIDGKLFMGNIREVKEQ